MAHPLDYIMTPSTPKQLLKELRDAGEVRVTVAGFSRQPDGTYDHYLPVPKGRLREALRKMPPGTTLRPVAVLHHEYQTIGAGPQIGRTIYLNGKS